MLFSLFRLLVVWPARVVMLLCCVLLRCHEYEECCLIPSRNLSQFPRKALRTRLKRCKVQQAREYAQVWGHAVSAHFRPSEFAFSIPRDRFQLERGHVTSRFSIFWLLAWRVRSYHDTKAASGSSPTSSLHSFTIFRLLARSLSRPGSSANFALKPLINTQPRRPALSSPPFLTPATRLGLTTKFDPKQTSTHTRETQEQVLECKRNDITNMSSIFDDESDYMSEPKVRTLSFSSTLD